MNGSPQPPLPGWLGSAVQITTQVGIPTVFAGILLWFVLFRLDGVLVQMRDLEVQREAGLQRVVVALENTAAKLTEANATRQATLEANRETAELLRSILQQQKEK